MRLTEASLRQVISIKQDVYINAVSRGADSPTYTLLQVQTSFEGATDQNSEPGLQPAIVSVPHIPASISPFQHNLSLNDRCAQRLEPYGVQQQAFALTSNTKQQALQGSDNSSEEGELPDTNPHAASGGTDKSATPDADSITSSISAKRKRGERAGKRVRQRQARRAKQQELEQQGIFLPTSCASRKSSTPRHSKPICK